MCNFTRVAFTFTPLWLGFHPKIGIHVGVALTPSIWNQIQTLTCEKQSKTLQVYIYVELDPEVLNKQELATLYWTSYGLDMFLVPS